MQQPAQTKKRSPWLWLGAGCASLITCACLGIGGSTLLASYFGTPAESDFDDAIATPRPEVQLQTAFPQSASTPVPRATALPAATSLPGIATNPPRPTALASPDALAPATSAPQRATVAPLPTATRRPAAGPRGDAARQRRVLDEVVGHIKDFYVYPDFNGVNLAAEQRAITSRIGTGLSDEAFHDEVRNLIERLNDKHSYYLSPAEVKEEEERASAPADYVGFGVNVKQSDDKRFLYLVQVYASSPAARAGLKAREHILSIDGKVPVDARGRIDDTLFLGPEGSTATLNVRAPTGETRQVRITRGRVEGAQSVDFRMLAGTGTQKIGYLHITTFGERNIIYRTRDALRELMTQAGGRLDGLVIDMRNNPGGFLPVFTDHVALFADGDIGQMVERDGTADKISVAANGVGNSQNVPLVILAGHRTTSFAEVFTGVMQRRGRAKIVGQPTLGIIETLTPFELEDGSELTLADTLFKLPDGSTWSRKGLIPDQTVPQKWEEATEANDAAIAAAIALLR